MATLLRVWSKTTELWPLPWQTAEFKLNIFSPILTSSTNNGVARRRHPATADSLAFWLWQRRGITGLACECGVPWITNASLVYIQHTKHNNRPRLIFSLAKINCLYTQSVVGKIKIKRWKYVFRNFNIQYGKLKKFPFSTIKQKPKNMKIYFQQFLINKFICSNIYLLNQWYQPICIFIVPYLSLNYNRILYFRICLNLCILHSLPFKLLDKSRMQRRNRLCRQHGSLVLCFYFLFHKNQFATCHIF